MYREYYAALAMQALLSSNFSPSEQDLKDVLDIQRGDFDPLVHWPKYIAKRAVTYADALIEELE